MSALLWRIIIAVVAVVLIHLVLPPLFRILGFAASDDVILILNVCIAGIALFYIIRGNPFPPA
jgi:hypothetical protein